MSINGLFLLMLITGIVLIKIVVGWKEKADLWDQRVGIKKDELHVPNYQELMSTKKYLQFKARMDYFFISASSFINWCSQRISQIKCLIVEEKRQY
jgi:hypothetical protein